MGRSRVGRKDITVDLIILGGGVAGLWTLNRALRAGYDAILLEKDKLGGGQTIRAQGIIHGGMKYAMEGVLTKVSNIIRDMPALWRTSLAGSGEIDLRGVTVLSNAHYLWSNRSLGGRVAAFFASHALRDRIAPVPVEDRPDAFRDKGFRGAVYRLNELVLDVGSLTERLAEPVLPRIFRAEPEDYTLETRAGKVTGLTFPAHGLTLRPRHMALCCGEGYEAFARRYFGAAPSRWGPFHGPLPRMQRRPLHMVMVKRHTLPPLYAHYLSGGPRPLVTLTTHYAKDSGAIWYLGGELAESGTKRDGAGQIEKAKSTLHELLPWVDLGGARWATLRVDRAEPRQGTLTLPDRAFAEGHGNLIVAWPTKLALAPDLAGKVMAHLAPAGGDAPPAPAPELAVLPRPAIAEAAWEGAFGPEV
uniref:Glycerol-3-phosphate dehydrogenase n=1 Tax=Candidatus Kentrum eta TaxID=2126337 RepID=A0A450VDH1_9GAMM|nr:MAG: Glycerol-3-phosphate dehydrogenase [Candidatus Kentron sp. H]VFJ97122.1 MAG: Glycerol-3-phosphate dehydrogenase [Candidatus Kentron sp. H]VFK02853.1 MAG: Glycerol-3-phosphate dehydrogenase [Candidatus Kentron sp. H]